MGILDTILRRWAVPDDQAMSLMRLPESPASDGKEVITVDPSTPLPDYPSRPPIVFVNGLD